MNSFKISQNDTDKLWTAIQNLSESDSCTEHTVEIKRRKMNDAPVNMEQTTSSLAGKPTLQSNESFVKISKYQVKYSIDLNKK